MRYIVQIVLTGLEGDEVMGCVEIDELGTKRARAKAQLLMGAWRKDGANSFRLIEYPKAKSRTAKAKPAQFRRQADRVV
jgi:hypothetical protein